MISAEIVPALPASCICLVPRHCSHIITPSLVSPWTMAFYARVETAQSIDPAPPAHLETIVPTHFMGSALRLVGVRTSRAHAMCIRCPHRTLLVTLSSPYVCSSQINLSQTGGTLCDYIFLTTGLACLCSRGDIDKHE